MSRKYRVVTWYGLSGWYVCNSIGSIVIDTLFTTRRDAVKAIAGLK
jgi:hypothetical protein